MPQKSSFYPESQFQTEVKSHLWTSVLSFHHQINTEIHRVHIGKYIVFHNNTGLWL